MSGQQAEAKPYGIRERCAMLALMALAREVTNGELDARYKLGLDKPQRERLNRDGLLDSRKEGRGFTHELTDKGWAWASRELQAGVPARAGSAGGALYAVLHGLATALQRHGMALSDLFAEAMDVDPAPRAPEIKGRAEPPALTLRDRIRVAYKQLAARPREWVYLSDLHTHLNGTTKAEIDSALREMFHAREVSLTLEEDQASLTKAQRLAALRLGADDMHLLSME